jgi:hypothetical protein
MRRAAQVERDELASATSSARPDRDSLQEKINERDDDRTVKQQSADRRRPVLSMQEA